MAVFQAPRGYHFSEDGAAPWAHFKRVPDARHVYQFETTDPKVIDRLNGIADVTRIDN
jgi:hypothetical protein